MLASSRVATVLVAALLLLQTPSTSTAVTVTRKRTPMPTTPTGLDVGDAEKAPEFTAGTIRPSTINTVEDENGIPIIGGPQLISPDPEQLHPSEQSTEGPAAPSTALPSKDASATVTTLPNVAHTDNKTNLQPTSSSPAPPSTTLGPTTSIGPLLRPNSTFTPSAESESPPQSSSSPEPREPTFTKNPEQPESSITRTTLSPASQSPQAVETAPTHHEKNWPLIALVVGIASVAVFVVLLLWRDTRVTARRTDDPTNIQNKTASADLEYDWYESSPNLSSKEASVDTFMGRQATRKESDAHVSSRAASTADLLNVSTVGDRSTGSNGSNRSQMIRDVNPGDQLVRATNTHRHHGSLERSTSSPCISFDEEVNALSTWSGSYTDSSDQTALNEQFPGLLQAQQSVSVYPVSGSAAFSPTSTDDLATSHSSDEDSSDEEDRASDRKPRRYSNGSAYSAVPSCSTAILGISPAIGDWSNLTLGSRRSNDSRDEEL